MPERRSSSSTSCSAALPRLVTRPSRSGSDGPGQGRLPGEQALAVEQAQQPVAVGRQPPEREGRVDVGHLQLQPAAPVVPGDPAPQPHLGAVGHAHPAAGVGQPGVDPAAGRVEQHDRQAGDRRPGQVAVGRGLDQVEPHGAAPPAGVEVADDAPHPQLVGERGAQAAARWPRPARAPTTWGRRGRPTTWATSPPRARRTPVRGLWIVGPSPITLATGCDRLGGHPGRCTARRAGYHSAPTGSPARFQLHETVGSMRR